LVILEVRTRQGDSKGSALESVDIRKVRQLQSIIPVFLHQAKEIMKRSNYRQIRFDVIALTVKNCRVSAFEHVRNAFDALD
jgi:putative endonuclease